MTVRFSSGTRIALANNVAFGRLFNRGSINIYTGVQPATADAAVTGTLLGTVTIGSGALTQETPATGTVTITGGTTSVLTLTVGGFNIIPDVIGVGVPYTTTTTQMATDLATAVNRNGIYSATSSGAVVTLTAPPATGAAHNTYAITSTGSVTATYVAMAGGITPVNGLTFLASPILPGVITKTGIWSFNGVAAGTAGWFRLIGSAADGGALQTGSPGWLPRMDGAIAVSGADLNLSNISVAIGAPNTIDTFTFTIPSQ